MEINATVLGFALGLTVVTALLFGLVPALKLSRAPKMISTMLAVGGRGGAPLSKRAGQWLIGIEVALALVLMTGAGLILRSFARLVSVDLGFNAANVLTVEVEPLDPSAAVRREYYASLTAALRQLPEVASAGAIDQLALGGGSSYSSTTADTGAQFDGPTRTVLPGYFEAMDVRAIAGRLLEDADRVTGEAVLINAIASNQYFGGNAVGHTLRSGGRSPRQMRVVGVVPTMRHGGPQGRIRPELYVLPHPNDFDPRSLRLAMVMRLKDGASLPIERLKQTAESIGPRVLVGRARPAADVISEQVTTPRHRMLLLTMLGVFGLLLTLVGIFSMTAYAVARRTREVGVRVAFGARPAQVVGVMIRDALWPVAFGLVAGLAGAYYAARVITTLPVPDRPARSPHARLRRRAARRRGGAGGVAAGATGGVDRSGGGAARGLRREHCGSLAADDSSYKKNGGRLSGRRRVEQVSSFGRSARLRRAGRSDHLQCRHREVRHRAALPAGAGGFGGARFRRSRGRLLDRAGQGHLVADMVGKLQRGVLDHHGVCPLLRARRRLLRLLLVSRRGHGVAEGEGCGISTLGETSGHRRRLRFGVLRGALSLNAATCPRHESNHETETHEFLSLHLSS